MSALSRLASRHVDFLVGLLLLLGTCSLANLCQAGELDQANEEKVRQALDEKTELQFIQTPLTDVLEFIEDLHQVEVMVDRRSLDDLGIDTDLPVDFQIQGVSLRAALSLMLRQYDLEAVIEEGVLLVTTNEAAEYKFPQVVVYDVSDLLTAPGTPFDEAQVKPEVEERLVNSLTDTVAPDSWDTNGSDGTARLLHGMLIVRQSQKVHDQLASLLADLREVRKRNDRSKASDQ